jgi:hypothetical protein
MGTHSLSQTPHSPCCLNLNINEAQGKLFWLCVISVILWPCRTDSGSSVPCRSLSFGLLSNRSICDGAPD